MDQRLLSFWGKLDYPKSENSAETTVVRTHPLLYHYVDTMECARSLWRRGFLSDTFKEEFEQVFGVGEPFYLFLAACHDLGKLTPEFQTSPSYHQPLTFVREKLLSEGLVALSPREYVRGVHEEAGAQLVLSLGPLLKDLGYVQGEPPGALLQLAVLTNISQGQLLPWPSIKRAGVQQRRAHSPAVASSWEMARKEMVRELLEYAEVPLGSLTLGELSSPSAQVLAGSIKVADWLASNPYFFPYREDVRSVGEYGPLAREAARYEANAVRLYAPRFREVSLPTIVGFDSPREMQVEAYRQAGTSPRASLTIIQAETGGGKTMAALAVATRKMREHNLYGLYMAMPTKITSLQAFREMQQWCGRVFEGKVAPHLEMGGWSDAFVDEAEYNPTVSGWLRGPRRNLLSPVSVGTVDQLMQAFQCRKYQTTRVAGLANRVVVFDEVHSYDPFQRANLLFILRWLSALQVPVVMLTATLTESFRGELLKAYAGDEVAVSSPGPMAVTTVSSEGCFSEEVPTVRGKHTSLEQVPCLSRDERVEEIVRRVGALARRESWGVVGVVRNTVDDSIDTAMALEEAYPEATVVLLHSRFTLVDRRMHEAELLSLAGKPVRAGRRERGLVIVVGTQLIEQALDIDFDYLFSDVAPMPALIQRLGRLHRWDDVERPSWGSAPECCLLLGVDVASSLSDERLYKHISPHSFAATVAVLEERESLLLPEDTRELLEAVEEWHSEDPTLVEVLRGEQVEIERKVLLAEGFMLPEPESERAWRDVQVRSDAVTRDGDSSMEVVLVEPLGEGLYRPVSASSEVALSVREDLSVWRESSVKVPHYWVKSEFLVSPECWEKTELASFSFVCVGNGVSYSRAYGARRES